MATYNLKALIDMDSVRHFNQLNQRLVIVKEARETDNVAWVAIAPFENNTVSWEQNYGVYASTSKIEPNSNINVSSYSDANEKMCYVFVDGVFDPPITDPTLGENMYEINNHMTDPDHLTFGLTQGVIANGNNYDQAPINAVALSVNQLALFCPHERIWVFMQANVHVGTVISRITGKILELDFAKNADIVIQYDPVEKSFVIA